jgi:hypothetical protein
VSIWRLQCTFGADSAFIRDRFVITPHFEVGFDALDPTAGAQVDTLCEDLATALNTWDLDTREITVKGYDAQGSIPVLPQGSAIRNVGLFPASTCPREMALCLSYYSGQNAPRRRGRLYIPVTLITGSGLGVRPHVTAQQKVLDLAPILKDLGGTNVDWVVYSRLDNDARPVSNYYVDDEWDIVRSRGMRPVTRLAGTASE